MTNCFLDKIDYKDVITHNCCYLNINDAVVEDANNSFVVGHLNIHSLPDKHDDLLELFEIMNEKNMLPDV